MSVTRYVTSARNSHSALWMVIIGVINAMNKQEEQALANYIGYQEESLKSASKVKFNLSEKELKLYDELVSNINVATLFDCCTKKEVVNVLKSLLDRYHGLIYGNKGKQGT